MTVKSLINHLSTLDQKLDVHIGGHGGKVTKIVNAQIVEGEGKKTKQKQVIVLVGV